MFDNLVLLLLAAGFSILAAPIIAITAHTRIGKLRNELLELKRGLEVLALRQREADGAPEAAPRDEESPASAPPTKAGSRACPETKARTGEPTFPRSCR